MNSPLCGDAQKHQERISANQPGKTTLSIEKMFVMYEAAIKELEAARIVIKAVENDGTRQPWFVLEALRKYYEATK